MSLDERKPLCRMPEDHDPEHSPAKELAEDVQAVGLSFFTMWRRLVSAAARGLISLAALLRNAGRFWLDQWRLVIGYHLHTPAAWEEAEGREREAAARFGVRAFISGIAIAALLISDARNSALPGIVLIVTELLWAGMRYIIIALVLPRGALERARLSRAFFAGLFPYLFGLTPTLLFAALVGSGLVTRRGFIAAGMRATDANLAVAWSFGGQLAVMAAGWLLRLAVALLVSA